jgi:hypothetical protein
VLLGSFTGVGFRRWEIRDGMETGRISWKCPPRSASWTGDALPGSCEFQYQRAAGRELYNKRGSSSKGASPSALATVWHSAVIGTGMVIE